MNNKFKATASVKLVIWDLDDTFWAGTLSEGDVVLIDRNIEIVKSLADRGIMSSICSKNEFESVKNILCSADVWDYFIFPHIAFSPKGALINNIIEQANLRSNNVLFIDDNSINLEEVRFLFPEMMVALPDDVLPSLLFIPEAKGGDDASHSRLDQYKKLERKVSEFKVSSLSNEEFLRQCDMKLKLDYDVDSHFDRIVELINRSNQLNFTKSRLDSAEKIEKFKENLLRYDIFSAAIYAADKYGDHGLVGFYMHFKNERDSKLIHFVFSCRIMNTGVEQFVYKFIGEPDIQVVEPVSNPIKSFDRVDWIEMGDASASPEQAEPDRRLLLLGSCDLTAVATYCSRNRSEYVNSVRNGVMTRFDDFGFILSDEDRVRKSTILTEIPCWQKEDHAAFRSDLEQSDALIVSLSAAMKGSYIVTNDEVVIRAHPVGLGHYIDVNPWVGFLKRCRIFSIDLTQREVLLKRSLETIASAAANAKSIVLLGANTREVAGKISQDDLALLNLYNMVAEDFCRRRQGWSFVSIDEVVSEDKLIDDRHYTRLGYFDIADHILKVMRSSATPSSVPLQRKDDAISKGAMDVVLTGAPLNWTNLLGPERGYAAQVKRAVKVSPFSGLVRKIVGKERLDAASVWQ